MFTQLSIRNFKAWQDTGARRLAPLTVFFGTNSSGKSSLLQFLLMLKQTVQSTDRRRVLHFGDRHSLVDLGGWHDVVFRHEEERALKFELRWDASKALAEATQRAPHTVREGTPLRFEAEVAASEVAASGGEAKLLSVQKFGYHVHSEEAYALGMHRPHIFYELWSENLSAESALKSRRSLMSPVRFYGFPGGDFGLGPSELGGALALELERQLSTIQSLGPLRRPPERYYTWSGTEPENVGRDGADAVVALLAVQGRRFDMPGGDGWTGPEELIALWLQQMGLLESFEVKPLVHRQYEVLVRAADTQVDINLTDIGFGISQVLPVLVQLIYADSGATLLFEQPELHLHPKAQSELADIFIDALDLGKDQAPREVQLLVETHSEHFLRRLQRRIAEEKLKPEQVALYFCKPGPEGATIEELKLDEYGRISNWPEDFFGDAVGDVEKQMDAALQRMEQEPEHAPK